MKVITPISAISVNGTSMKKTQRHEYASDKAPPSAGARIGPMMTPVPQIDMTRLRTFASKRSITMAWLSGTSGAPKAPCPMR